MVGICTCDCKFMHCPEEGLRSFGAGVADGCDPPDLGKAGNNLGSSARAV